MDTSAAIANRPPSGAERRGHVGVHRFSDRLGGRLGGRRFAARVGRRCANP